MRISRSTITKHGNATATNSQTPSSAGLRRVCALIYTLRSTIIKHVVRGCGQKADTECYYSSVQVRITGSKITKHNIRREETLPSVTALTVKRARHRRARRDRQHDEYRLERIV